MRCLSQAAFQKINHYSRKVNAVHMCVCALPNNLLTALSILIKLCINARCLLRPCFEFVKPDGQDI
jgi:hypothetical protein